MRNVPPQQHKKSAGAADITINNYKQFSFGNFPTLRIIHTLDVSVERPNTNRILLPPMPTESGEYLIVRAPGHWQEAQGCKKSPATAEFLAEKPTLEQYFASAYVTDTIRGIITTLDNKIVAMRRSGKTNNPHEITLPAGGCDFKEAPPKTLERELLEELNISRKRYSMSTKPLTMTLVPASMTLNYVYLVNSKDGFNAMCKRAISAEDSWEWDELIPLDANAAILRDFALNQMAGKGSKVALLAFADYLEEKCVGDL